MAVILDGRGCLYHPLPFENEAEFERSVVNLADQIFGPNTIYVDVKRRVSGNDVVTIPDGYVIDMTEPDEPKLFVIENEVVSHDPFQHIGIQMLKFVTSLDGAKLAIRAFLMDEIAGDQEKLARLEAGCSQSRKRNIDNYLDQAAYGSFRGIVVIDEGRPELHHVLEKINANISVLELRRFETEGGQQLFQFDTLYDEYEDQAFVPDRQTSRRRTTADPDARGARRARRAAADTVIVPAREDGFLETFIGENRWYAIRIGAAMKERIKHIAAYQVAPISAVTHIAEVQDIRLYEDTGKYVLTFAAPAVPIGPIRVRDVRYSPQGPIYVQRVKLEQSQYLEDALA